MADSTMKVEYIVISEAVKEAFWFKKFIAKLDVMALDTVLLCCDNNGAIVLAKELKSYQKSKHIKQRFYPSMITSKKDTSR